MPAVKIGLPRTFGQCCVLALPAHITTKLGLIHSNHWRNEWFEINKISISEDGTKTVESPVFNCTTNDGGISKSMILCIDSCIEFNLGNLHDLVSVQEAQVCEVKLRGSDTYCFAQFAEVWAWVRKTMIMHVFVNKRMWWHLFDSNLFQSQISPCLNKSGIEYMGLLLISFHTRVMRVYAR